MIDFDNTFIKPRRTDLTSRRQVQLERTFTFNTGVKWTTVPIIISNMSTTGVPPLVTNEAIINSKISVALHKWIGTLPSTYQCPSSITGINSRSNVNDKTFEQLKKHDNWWHTVGVPPDEDEDEDSAGPYWEELDLKAKQTNKICVDVANGYMEKFVQIVSDIRKKYPKHIIMAGNVCTPEGASELALAGADIIKVGIGPGHLCRTRRVTGVGYPQLQAIKDICNKIQYNVYICSDGGIRYPGDASKAFVAGADFVMMGSYFLGCDELGCEGYGMASQKAVDIFGYQSSYRPVEGVTETFEKKGPISGLLQQLLGGIRSCCTYTNSKTIEDLHYAELISYRD